MPRYSYSAYGQNGELENGELHATSDVAALHTLSSRGLKPVSLTAGGSAERWWQRDISLTGATAGANPDSLENFFRTLASLLEVRFPLPRALQFCVAQARDRRLKRVLGRVTDAVADGQTLSAGMQAEDGFFPDRFIAIVEVGETANKLPDIAGRAAETLAAEAGRRRELRAALIYPVILLAMSLLVLAMMVFYLAPTLMPVFGSAGTEPPAILRTMTGIRAALISGWPIIIAGVVGFILALRVAGSALRRLSFQIGLGLPGIGTYLRQVNTLNLCHTLALMLSSGAPLPRAVATARETATSPRYRDLLSSAFDTINAGGTLHETIAPSPLIDPIAGAMIEAGEESDQLAPVLDRLVTDLRTRSSGALAQAIRMITPLLTLIIGIGVGAVILSTVSAIMNLNDIAF